MRNEASFLLPWLHLFFHNACPHYLKSRRDLLYLKGGSDGDLRQETDDGFRAEEWRSRWFRRQWRIGRSVTVKDGQDGQQVQINVQKLPIRQVVLWKKRQRNCNSSRPISRQLDKHLDQSPSQGFWQTCKMVQVVRPTNQYLKPVQYKDGNELNERVGGHVFEDAERRDEGGTAFANHSRNARYVSHFGSKRRCDRSLGVGKRHACGTCNERWKRMRIALNADYCSRQSNGQNLNQQHIKAELALWTRWYANKHDRATMHPDWVPGVEWISW